MKALSLLNSMTAARVIVILIMFLAASPFGWSQEKYLDARQSDPSVYGWMQGFPPPSGRRLSSHDGSFFEFPALRYSVVHMREFFPAMNVPRGNNGVSWFTYNTGCRIDSLVFEVMGTGEKMNFRESLYRNYTDGIIILHRGKVVYEKYFAALIESDVHSVMSLTKSFTGTIASVLVAEGLIDEKKPVSDYVPELAYSAFGDATVREVMDMITALRYREDYADPEAEVWQFSAAGNPVPKPAGYSGPVGYYEYLMTAEKKGQHGKAFGYKTVNSDALGWIIARVTGKNVAELLSERIWSKIGMEQDAYYQVDGLATPFAGGGLNAGLRDLARFGELIRNKGRWNGLEIIPELAVTDITRGGSTDAFARAGYSTLKGWSYRNMWWITENDHGAFMGRGVHGQTIYVDPKAEMVLVRLASHPVAGNAANDPYSLPAYQAVADHLIKKMK